MKHLTLSLHPFAAAGLFLLLFAAPKDYAFAVLSSVFLHEMGHTVAALLLKKRIVNIKLVPTGINISLSAASSYAEEFAIAAAGPLMNLLWAGALSLLSLPISETVQSVSLLLAVLNLLPISLLDGGRMMKAVLSLISSEQTAEHVANIMNLFFLAALWILSLYIFFYSGVNFMLLLFCAYLFSYIIMKKF